MADFIGMKIKSKKWIASIKLLQLLMNCEWT